MINKQQLLFSSAANYSTSISRQKSEALQLTIFTGLFITIMIIGIVWVQG